MADENREMHLAKVDHRRQYFRLARVAIVKGIITQQEADIIRRRNHRKSWAWASHYRRLQDIVRHRLSPDYHKAA